MEITKGENANLAGMEPRCPKCKAPASIYWMLGHHEGKCNGVACEYGSVNWQEFFHAPERPKIEVVEVCPANAPDKHSVRVNGKEIVAFDSGHSAHSVAGNLRMALAQFFRSPAPTPPLDVEAEKRIAEIRERESKATKGPWKVYPSTNPYMSAISGRNWSQFSEVVTRIQGTTEDNPTGVANAAFMAHSRQDIPFLLEQISLLRRHIASPAPQSNTEDDIPEYEFPAQIKAIFNRCEAGVDYFINDDVSELLHEIKRLAASPAQPEKRDEWVSVDERLPDFGNTVLVVADGKTKVGYRREFLKQEDLKDWQWQINPLVYYGKERNRVTHWQPLPAPPQSGKEGQ